VVLFILRRERFPLASTVVLGVLTAGALGYGALRLDHVLRLEEAAPRLRVALIQGALPPERRGREGLQYYLEATERALGRGAVDLVVWPEGAISGAEWPPFDLTPQTALRGVRGGQAAVALARKVEELGVALVAGGTGYDATRQPPVSNVLAYFHPGRLPAFYEKNIRVPGGEYVPLLEHLPESWRRQFAHIGTLAAGTTNPLLSLGDRSFRSLICYEAVLPGYVARTAEGADFLVNITEDVWYGRTAHIPQHVSVVRLRVVENRTPVVRCTNMGPSGVFTLSGRFRGSRAVFEPAEDLVAFGARRLPTMYGLWGRFLPLGLLCVAVSRWVLERIRSRRQLPKMS
jgi:apolipoprotein N-acyltransferase